MSDSEIRGAAARGATVFMSFHRTQDAAVFTEFAELVRADAAAARGYVGWQLSVLTSPLLEQAIALIFDDLAAANDWLDSAKELLTSRGFLRAALELFVNGSPLTPGVLLVREVVEPSREASFRESAEHIAGLERIQPGHEASSVFPPNADERAWATVVRFRTESQLNSWLASPELNRALPKHWALLSEESQVTTATSFGATVRVTDGQAAVTPQWKTAMSILLFLYPLVMLISRFIDPWLHPMIRQPSTAIFLDLAISITLLTWVLMPVSARLLGRWLDPIDGAGARPSLIGAAAVCGGYLLFLLLFSSVGFLRL